MVVAMATGDGTYSVGDGTFSTTTGGITWDSSAFNSIHQHTSSTLTPPPNPCELLGHKIEKWAEYLDGECVGVCSNCMVRVTSQRMPGGMPFMRLKALAELLIITPEDASLFLEINEITDLLDAEQRSLDEARALLATARKMARCDES